MRRQRYRVLERMRLVEFDLFDEGEKRGLGILR